MSDELVKPLELVPGNWIEVTCPYGSKPLVEKNALIPDSENSFFVVMSIHDSTLQLGPLRAGPFEGIISCSDGKEIHLNTQLTPVNPQQLPKRAPPISPFEVKYPHWIFYGTGILLLIFLISGISYRVYKTKRHASKVSWKNQILCYYPTKN